MSYRADYEECLLLCESIDRFVPQGIPHYIFVNDEDWDLFKPLAGTRRLIYPKSVVLPRALIRVPFRLFGHHFHISPFSIPVREWIIQQIVKLSVWEIINPEYEVFLNVDSENVFMKPFLINSILRQDRLGIFRRTYQGRFRQAYTQFFASCKKLLGLEQPIDELMAYDYMGSVVGFKRSTLYAMCNDIAQRHWSHNYKIALMNTYRFSEYFLYALFAMYKEDVTMQGHFELQDNLFPMCKYSDFQSSEAISERIGQLLDNDNAFGIFFQKNGTRFRNDTPPVPFSELRKIIYSYWE